MKTGTGTPRVDYDDLAGTYHRRYQASPMPGVQTALRELATTASVVVEAGCGTGFWLELLRDLSHKRLGVDRSLGMLRQAQTRRVPAGLVQGDAVQLPLGSESCDLLFCVNALHHFGDQQRFVETAFRLLRPGGRLAIFGSGPPASRSTWYVYRYFPGTYETDQKRFPAWEQVAGWMISAGFSGLERRLVERIDDSKTGRDVLQDPFLDKKACSQLALLSQETYDEGINRIEADLRQAESRGNQLIFQSQQEIYLLLALKPGKSV